MLAVCLIMSVQTDRRLENGLLVFPKISPQYNAPRNTRCVVRAAPNGYVVPHRHHLRLLAFLNVDQTPSNADSGPHSYCEASHVVAYWTLPSRTRYF